MITEDYVKFKYLLSSAFNHSFENLHNIVCWDTELKHGEGDEAYQ